MSENIYPRGVTFDLTQPNAIRRQRAISLTISQSLFPSCFAKSQNNLPQLLIVQLLLTINVQMFTSQSPVQPKQMFLYFPFFLCAHIVSQHFVETTFVQSKFRRLAQRNLATFVVKLSTKCSFRFLSFEFEAHRRFRGL